MEYRYRPGGLVRCCTLTLLTLHEAGDLVIRQEEDARVPCRYCSTTMIFVDGAWQRDTSAKSKYGDVPVPTEAELA